VCVTTYNYARFLPQCIESVLAQDLTDFELIICDDCSSDDTEDVVARFARTDSRIRAFRNEVNLGMNPNLKRCAELARGEFIKVLCADDWIAPNCLSRMVQLMDAHPSVLLAASAEVYTDERGIPIRRQFQWGESVTVLRPHQSLQRIANVEGMGGNSSLFLRRTAYVHVGGYDSSLLYAADLDLAWRISLEGDYLHTDDPLFFGRDQPASSSQVNTKKLLDVQDYLVIPGKILRPRPLFSPRWRAYQLATSKVTARYLLNFITQLARGNTSYANKLLGLTLRDGNLVAGVLRFPAYAIERLGTKIGRYPQR
jgi:glycosyltransferase involved in cell wall biosynthesis